jgi:hypothetical protein
MSETKYGTWTQFNSGESSVRHGIEQAIGDQWLKDHDLDAIESDYRELINAKLCDTGIKLVGEEFIGPAEECNGCREMAPAYIHEVIASVDNDGFWPIVRKHRKS